MAFISEQNPNIGGSSAIFFLSLKTNVFFYRHFMYTDSNIIIIGCTEENAVRSIFIIWDSKAYCGKLSSLYDKISDNNVVLRRDENVSAKCYEEQSEEALATVTILSSQLLLMINVSLIILHSKNLHTFCYKNKYK